MKIGAYLWCVLQALIVGYFVAVYANDSHPVVLGVVVFTALMFIVILVDGIRRGP
jgi:purine-cytosine permease-like protein